MPCAPSNITEPPLGNDLVQQPAGVGDKRTHLFGGCRILLVHLFGIQRIGAEERMGNRILLGAGCLDVRLQERCVQQIDDAQPAARHLVFIRGADAAAGGADALASRGAFGGKLDHAVVGQNHLRAVGDKELPIDFDAKAAQLGHFFEKSDRIKHHAVADDALAAAVATRRRE